MKELRRLTVNMNTWFEFKGINSKDMGVILSVTPPITRASKRYNQIYIDGRDGCETETLGYSAYEKKMQIGVKDINNLSDISNWLTGDGRLTIWNEPDIYYDAKIMSQIDYTKKRRFATADIPFLVQPFKFQKIDEITSNLNVYNHGNCDALPYLKIYGSGNVMLKVNGKDVCQVILNTINNIELDSITQDAYYNGELANRYMFGDFPVFKQGINVISYTGNVTKIETRVRSRWL